MVLGRERFEDIIGGSHNQAIGPYSIVSGGYQRSAAGDHDWVAGSLFENQ